MTVGTDCSVVEHVTVLTYDIIVLLGTRTNAIPNDVFQNKKKKTF